jgi:hypothetical protein
MRLREKQITLESSVMKDARVISCQIGAPQTAFSEFIVLPSTEAHR